MRNLTLRVALAVLAALAIAACSDNYSPTSPTASSGTTSSALAEGDDGQRQAVTHKPKHGGGGGGGGEKTDICHISPKSDPAEGFQRPVSNTSGHYKHGDCPMGIIPGGENGEIGVPVAPNPRIFCDCVPPPIVP